MGLFSFFQGGAKYFDKKIDPKCDYCTYGKRTKDGNRVLCEKRGLVEQNYSCKAFIYSPLKRIPVKQLRFVGSIADDDIFIESKGDLAEKAEAEKKSANDNKKPNENNNAAKAANNVKPAEAEQPKQQTNEANNAPAPKAPQAPKKEEAAQNAVNAPAPNPAPEKKEAPKQNVPQAQNQQAKHEAPKK